MAKAPIAPTTEPADVPTYKVIAETKIPVSKSAGTLWKSRRDQAIKKRENANLIEAWEQALRYYKNDQLSHRMAGADGTIKGNGLAERIDMSFNETENIVFANVTSTTPLLYSRNPDAQVDSINPELEQLAKVSEDLLTTLFNKKEAPGINLKPKSQRAVVSAQLCNLAWAEVGWTEKADSLEQHYNDLMDLAQKLEKAKGTEEYAKIEGELMQLERTSDLLSPSGPFVKIHPPANVLRDPFSVEEDLSDCNWMMVADFPLTTALRAKYYKRNNEDNTDESLYEPTQILGAPNEQEDLYSYSAFDKGKSYVEAGYSSQEEYDSKKVTKVWYVWDKTTRRVLLYHDKCWTFPIWVWDDPLQLSNFFPFVQLSIHCAPDGPETKGEVTYYLDQQDAINFYNSTKNAALSWLGTKFAYDSSKLEKSDAEALLRAKSLHMVPLQVPEGTDLKAMMPQAIEHPALRYMQLFDKGPIIQAISRITGTNEAMMGAQYKTNTTNDAVSAYNQFASIRIDNARDKIEDFVGTIGYYILQLCWMKMDQATVAALIGNEKAANWINLDPKQIKALSVNVVGGSTQKPTSENKKKMSLELAQILGQFASVTPLAFVVALKVIERGFEEVVITDQDWQMIMDSILGQLQAQQQQATGAPTDPNAQDVAPEIKMAYDELISRGVPPEQAKAMAPDVAQKAKTGGNPRPN